MCTKRVALTLVLLRRLVGDDVPEYLPVGPLGLLPADLESVHRDLGEAKLAGRAGNALEKLFFTFFCALQGSIYVRKVRDTLASFHII